MMNIKQNFSKIDKVRVKEMALTFFSEMKEKITFNDLDKVNLKLPRMKKGALTEVWNHINVLWVYVNNKDISIIEKTLPLAALVYVVSPLDAVPDSIPILGLIDDASIVSFVFASITTKLNDKELYASFSKLSKEPTCLEKVVDHKERIRVLTSLLTHAAYADGEMSSVEDNKLNQILDFLVFAEDGWFSNLEEADKNKFEIKELVKTTINQPLSLKKIIEFVTSINEDEELWYFYAYTIVASDNDINSSERDFLDYLGESFNISKYDISRIERIFSEIWLLDK